MGKLDSVHNSSQPNRLNRSLRATNASASAIPPTNAAIRSPGVLFKTLAVVIITSSQLAIFSSPLQEILVLLNVHCISRQNVYLLCFKKETTRLSASKLVRRIAKLFHLTVRSSLCTLARGKGFFKKNVFKIAFLPSFWIVSKKNLYGYTQTPLDFEKNTV